MRALLLNLPVLALLACGTGEKRTANATPSTSAQSEPRPAWLKPVEGPKGARSSLWVGILQTGTATLQSAHATYVVPISCDVDVDSATPEMFGARATLNPHDLYLAVNDSVVIRPSKAPCEVFVARDLAEIVLGSPISHLVKSAKETTDLTWAAGKMHASILVDDAKYPASLGLLSGTSPVAEHAHDTSWEILYAEAAVGSFVLGGVETQLGPAQFVFVPPGVKHAWRPTAGSSLRAIQMYSPPGPEQRFKKLAETP